MSTDATKAAKNAPGWNCRAAAHAVALPTSTGTTAAGSVAGRAAMSHIFRAPGRSACGRSDGPTPNPALREAWELGEIGLPLLKECVPSFFGFVGHVEQQRRVAGQLLQARQPVGVRVEGGLQEPDSRRAHLQNLLGPLDGLFLQLLQR